MTLHFLIVDHALTEQHGERDERVGHWVLAVSVLAGRRAGSTRPLSDAARRGCSPSSLAGS
jgi:hypothetical protein